jgi:predicted MFS family arabinose efflux permease
VTDRTDARLREWSLLAALTALHLLNYLDRQLVVTLAPLLMADLGLSRARIGLLVGASFVLVFGFGTLVLGAASDRFRRPRLIALGLAVWSVGTAGSAAAAGFAQLVAMRLLVGLGEAVLAPTALSMLGDRIPAARLGFASGVFYAAIPLGFGLSFALSGWIGPWLGWRACFLLLGLAGLLFIPAVLRLDDPPRRGAGTPARAAFRQQLVALRGALAERPAILLVSLAAAALAFSSASSQHTITWLVEEHRLPYPRAAFLSALVVGPAGLLGNLVLGTLTDRWRRPHAGGRLVSLAVLGFPGLGFAAAFYLLPMASPLFGPAWFLGQMFLLGWFGAVVASLDELASPGQSGTVLGFGLLTINLGGVALGPWITGLIGDRAGLGLGLLVSLAVGGVGLGLLVEAGQLARREPESPPLDNLRPGG